MNDPEEYDGEEVTENGETVVWYDNDGEQHVTPKDEWDDR